MSIGIRYEGKYDRNACAGYFPESFNPAKSSRFVLPQTTIVAKVWITLAPSLAQ